MTELTLDQALQKGVEAHKAGNAQEADRYYTAILKAQPNHPDANHNMGVLAVGVGKLEMALPFFEKAIEVNSTIAQFWLSLIDTLIKLQRFDEAQSILKRAKANGFNTDSFNKLEKQILQEAYTTQDQIKNMTKDEIIELREKGYIDQAIRELKKTIINDDNDFQLFCLLSHCLIIKGDLEKAEDYLNQAKKLNEQAALIGWTEARLFLKQKDPLNALEIARKFHALYPTDIEGIGVLGACLRVNNLNSESLNYLNQAIESDNNYAEAYLNRGLIRLSQNDDVLALVDLEIAHKIKPHLAEIWPLLGNIYFRLNDYPQATQIYTKLVELEPSNPTHLHTLALSHYKNGNIAEAIEKYEETIKLQPNNPEAYNNLGIALNNQKQFKNALHNYKKAIEIYPNYIAATGNIGDLYYQTGEYEKAIEFYEKVLKLKPDHASANVSVGNSISALGDREGSVKSYKKAIEIDPNHCGALWNLYGASSDIEEAKMWISKCLKADQFHTKALLTSAMLEVYEDPSCDIDTIIDIDYKNHPYIRSFKWVLGLPVLPKLIFNRWAFFDFIIEQCEKKRPFYEFGVWRGYSFKYLISALNKGYGFDTFSGLPEEWYNERVGGYSSDDKIPEVEGGKFIKGKFEDTLPTFFKQKRPVASVINFDADLYSSTLCALNNCKDIIDHKAILVFDEFLMNGRWEEDEYRALVEFCENNKLEFEVIAISFFTKQVAVRLKDL